MGSEMCIRDSPRGMSRFSAFAGGMDMFEVNSAADADDATNSLRMLNGTARFQGPAAGKYVTRNLVANTAEIGQFTADAELLANFGTSGTETANAGSVSGSVTNFMENGESLGNWSLTLAGHNADGVFDEDMGAMLDALGTDTDDTTGGVQLGIKFVGGTKAMVGGANAYGIWTGTFYGDERKDGRPNAVAGMFDAIACLLYTSPSPRDS